MPVVVDASVALRWCFPDEYAPACDALRDRLELDVIVAPAIWLLETANALVVAQRHGRISQAKIDEFVEMLLAQTLDIESTHATRAWRDVLVLAQTHRLTMYDAVYLELAARRGFEFATLDDALRKAATAHGVACVDLPKS